MRSSDRASDHREVPGERAGGTAPSDLTLDPASEAPKHTLPPAGTPDHAAWRLLAVEAHPLFLCGLRAVVAGREDMELVGCAASLAEARALIGQRPVDIAIVALELPDGSGLRLLEDAAWGGRAAPIVFLCERSGAHRHDAVEVHPAAIVVDGSITGGALMRAILGVATDDPLAGPAVAAIETLPPRQLQIVGLVASGRSNDEIAAALGIATTTVETHLSRLYRRFELQGRIELLLLAQRVGWLERAGGAAG